MVLATRDNEAMTRLLAQHRPDLEVRDRTPGTATPADLAWADVYVGAQWPEAGDLADVRWVHSPYAGVDALLGGRAWPAGTLLTRTVGSFATRIGEYCLARALAACQHLPSLLEAQRARRWQPRTARDLHGSRVVVVGAGHIGRGIGRAFAAAGCAVDGVSRSGRAQEPFGRVWASEQMKDAVTGAAWVILVLPHTPDTERLVDRAVLDCCEGAFLINVGRGRTVDEAALVEALQNGTLRGAALDVFETEPLPDASPLWDLPNVMLSPHCAAWTLPEEAVADLLEALDALEAGCPLPVLVDPVRGY
jgi:phosphoglycerate dehydrogenase-like enzyme